MPEQSPGNSQRRPQILSANSQLVWSFLVPTLVLLFLSDESRLGPLRAMLVALAPPLALELYSLRVRRKPSLISIMAILGILFVGVVSSFGLSEVWLAVRRSAIYVIAAVSVVGAMHFKRDIIDKALARTIDMDTVQVAAADRKTLVELSRLITRTGYALALLLLIIGVASYLMTIVFITSPTGTSAFNTQYAQLRLQSLIFITLPFLVGITGLFIYLLSGIERLTGIKTEELLKKKR